MNPSGKPFAAMLRIGVTLFCFAVFTQAALAISSVEGTVYGDKRTPLSDVWVELLNTYGQSVARSKTDGTGRYRFDGLSDGRYSVRAMPFTHNYFDQTIPVNIVTQNIRGGEGTGHFQVDFYLKPKRAEFTDTTLGVVFAQEVPKAAEKHYEKAVKDLDDKRDAEGFAGLNEAINVFPNYFNATHRLGLELYKLKRYKEAVAYFVKSAEINPKSVTALYYLGTSLHHLGKDYNKAAITTLIQANEMAPTSMQILLSLGAAERAGGKFDNAEKHLLAAKKAAKGDVPEIHLELAQLYANDMKKYKEAADELEAYLKSSKVSGDETKNIKRKIDEMREKAKSQVLKS